MTKKHTNKKSLSLLLAFLMILTILTPILSTLSAYAMSIGEKTTIGKYHIANAPRYELIAPNLDSAGNVQGYNYGWAEPFQKFYMESDGTPVYCIEFEQKVSGGNLTAQDQNVNAYFKGLTEPAKAGVTYLSIYSYPNNHITGTDGNQQWIVAQALMWEYTTGLRTSAGSTGFGEDGLKSYTTTKAEPMATGGQSLASWSSLSSTTLPAGYTARGDQLLNQIIRGNTERENIYKKLLTDIRNHAKTPSFTHNSNSPVDPAPTHDLKYNNVNGRWEKTVTDTAGVLASMKFDNKVNGVNYEQSGNSLYIWTTQPIKKAQATAMQKILPNKSGKEGSGLILHPDDNLQEMLVGALDDPQRAFFNVRTEDTGTLKLVKTSEDGLIAGITFNVKGNGLDKDFVTGADGSFTIPTLSVGTYTVTEKAPSRYVQPKTKTVSIIANGTSSVDFDNVLKKWNLTVNKVDSETGTAQGDGTLDGAVYGIYDKDNKLVDSYTIKDGTFITKNYVCGTGFYVQEITPSTGYLIDPTKYPIPAEAGNYTIEINPLAQTSKEDVIKGKVALIKHNDDGSTQIETPEVGAEFEVYLKSAGSFAGAKDTEKQLLVTDEYGFAQTKDLPYGWYTVKQTKGITGADLMPAFDVFIAENGKTYRYLINNADIYADVKIVKKDIETGKIIPVAGIGFKIKDLQTGKWVSQHINYPTPIDIDEFYTGNDGTLMLPYAIKYGEYELHEIQTADGYVLDSTPIRFVIDGTQNVVVVEKNNIAQKFTISIEKTGEVFTSMKLVNGKYQPVYTKQGIPGAVYNIIALEDIITPDGTLRASKDEIVDTITTDDSGKAISKLLYLGKYARKEIKAPHGYLPDGTLYEFEGTYQGQHIATFDIPTTHWNERQKVEIELLKQLETDELFNIGFGDEYKNVVFGLFARTDLVAVDGSTIPADGLIEEINLDELLKGKVQTDLPAGSYYIKEIATDDHYILSDKEYDVSFEYDEDNPAVLQIFINDGMAISNTLKRGRIDGIKVDQDGSPLAHAVIGLFKAGETEFTAENALMTAISNIDGTWHFDGVAYGDYVIREIEAPKGYILSDEIFNVSITEDEQEIIGIEIVNELGNGSIIIHKTDQDGNPLAGVTIQLLDKDKNVIGEAVTGADGIVRFDDLVLGEQYYYRETDTLDDYVLDTRAYEFMLTEAGGILERTLVNYKVNVPPRMGDSIALLTALTSFGVLGVVTARKRKQKGV